ncbi:hypothetical protein Lpp230_1431 [Lacticaseibacillus paracasei subsp. paracasei Lpp230]|nr:hypothetical protein Lpp230_1431 [Lacticaseibacillus paracasei subsp. paracasei Lpp230]
MAKTRPSHPRPLTFRFLTGLVHALAETRSQAQKPTHKGLEPKWPEPSHLGSRPLMLRFLTAPVHALLASYRVLREDTS